MRFAQFQKWVSIRTSCNRRAQHLQCQFCAVLTSKRTGSTSLAGIDDAGAGVAVDLPGRGSVLRFCVGVARPLLVFPCEIKPRVREHPSLRGCSDTARLRHQRRTAGSAPVLHLSPGRHGPCSRRNVPAQQGPETNHDEPESLASLVQVFRFLGMLDESIAVHRRAREIDPAVVTSLAYTLYLAGDYAGTIESYGGRGAFYLDAAAWAGLGEGQRAKDLLADRLCSLPMSPLITALLTSLLATLEGDKAKAMRVMEQADTTMQPEVMMYFARHYSYLNEPQRAIQSIRTACKCGFVCSPSALRNDAWLASVLSHPAAAELTAHLDGSIKESRAVLQLISDLLVAREPFVGGSVVQSLLNLCKGRGAL